MQYHFVQIALPGAFRCYKPHGGHLFPHLAQKQILFKERQFEYCKIFETLTDGPLRGPMGLDQALHSGQDTNQIIFAIT